MCVFLSIFVCVSAYHKSSYLCMLVCLSLLRNKQDTSVRQTHKHLTQRQEGRDEHRDPAGDEEGDEYSLPAAAGDKGHGEGVGRQLHHTTQEHVQERIYTAEGADGSE